MKHIINLMGHDLKYGNIEKAENCRLFDSCGDSYLDLESGVWCTSLGHSNPVITRTIADNAGKFMHAGYCYNSSIVDAAAGKVLGVCGHEGGKCVFLSSGSEAVDLSINIALHVTGRRKILTMSDSYLSAFGHFAMESGNVYKFSWLENDDVDSIPFEDFAAFVFEPGSSSGLVRFPPQDLIAKIIDGIMETGGLVIANEVTTGIGRTGAWFGHNHYLVSPDIVAMGKGLGNGYPVSCVSLACGVADRIDATRFHYSQSHQNDPLGASVALSVLNLIESEGYISRADEVGSYILSNLEEIRRGSEVIKEVRGRGLMLAIEFHSFQDRSIAEEVSEKLFQRGIIVVRRPNQEVIRLDPALTIGLSDIDLFLESFCDIIKGL
nr:aminotransferase class III-fold pyridoxal phosphate-dependent enzyme [uncultured Dethiosulfovibrio sp.]